MAMEFVSMQAQLDMLDVLTEYYLADKDENGRVRLVFHDKSGDGEDVDNGRNLTNSIAYYLGLVEGRGDGPFDPEGLITREESAVMLTRAYRVMAQRDLTGRAEAYEDREDIAPWAQDSVAALARWQVMKGTAPGVFSPRGSYTREQCIVTFLRLYENAPVSRKNNNVPRMFTYDQIMACVDANEAGLTPDADQYTRFRQNSRWEGPTATAIDQSMWGVMLGARRLFFVYRDGRLREFDPHIYNIWGNMLTGSVPITDGTFSEDGSPFTCTAALRGDVPSTDSEGNELVQRAGLYHITVDVETLEVTQTWEPLPEGMFDQ